VREQSGAPRHLALQALVATGPEASAALIKELEHEQADRSRRQLKAVLTGWARTDKETVRLLVAGLGKKYQDWWADDVLVKAGKTAAGPVADAMIADRGYGGTTWAAADALQGPVVDRLVHMSRGGEGSSRATHVPLYWVLGSY
jgi:hypothetical protein